MTESDMVDEPEDPDTAADRLEAALERIARLTSARPPTPVPDPPDDTLSVPEIAERLDHLIGRLRAALEKHSGDTSGDVAQGGVAQGDVAQGDLDGAATEAD